MFLLVPLGGFLFIYFAYATYDANMTITYSPQLFGSTDSTRISYEILQYSTSRLVLALAHPGTFWRSQGFAGIGLRGSK